MNGAEHVSLFLVNISIYLSVCLFMVTPPCMSVVHFPIDFSLYGEITLLLLMIEIHVSPLPICCQYLRQGDVFI